MVTQVRLCIILCPKSSRCARSSSPPSMRGCFHGDRWNSMMLLAFWSCSSGSYPIRYWLWSTSMHFLPSTVCAPLVPFVFGVLDSLMRQIKQKHSVRVHRAPHKESAAASVEPAHPLITRGQSGYTEGRCTLSLNLLEDVATFPLQHRVRTLLESLFPLASPGTGGVFPACNRTSGQQ